MITPDFSVFPILNTERLLLRALESTDAEEVFALRSDDNINKYINRHKAQTIDDAYQFIERIKQNTTNNLSLLWVIELKNDHSFAGSILLWNLNAEKDEAEIGYELLPRYHGKGIINEALKAVLDLAFNTLQIATIVAVVQKDNIPSLKVLEKYNFVFRAEVEDNLQEFELNVADFRSNQ